VIGVDDERRPVLFGPPHPLPQELVDESVVGVDRSVEPPEVLLRDALHARRHHGSEDVADAVCFLASPAAAMVRGQTLVVDGGYSNLA